MLDKQHVPSIIALLMTSAGLLSSPANASVVGYFESSLFEAATSDLIVEDYASYTSGTHIPNGSSLGGVQYTFNTAAGLGGLVTNLYSGFSGQSLTARQIAGDLSEDDVFQSGEGFTITFSSPMTALGIFSNSNLPIGLTLAIPGFNEEITNDVAYDRGTSDFVSVISSTPFTSATFSSSGNPFTVPEIEYGSAPVSSVPLPAASSMFGAALLMFGLIGFGLKANRSARKRFQADFVDRRHGPRPFAVLPTVF